jgi:hypothetical protein
LGNWLQVRLQQPGPNRDGIGAWLEVELPGRVLRRELTVGGGHVSGGLGFVHFGLGNAKEVRLRVRWPDGLEETALVSSNRFVRFVRGQGPQNFVPGQSY